MTTTFQLKNGNAIATTALLAMHDSSYIDVPGDCEMFTREVVERCGVQLFQQIMDRYRAGSARETMNNFAGTKYAAWNKIGVGGVPTAVLQVAGALVFKGDATSGPDGHVGMLFHNMVNGQISVCVAENSSFHIIHPGGGNGYGQGVGAKGWRTLEEFGKIELVVFLWN